MLLLVNLFIAKGIFLLLGLSWFSNRVISSFSICCDALIVSNSISTHKKLSVHRIGHLKNDFFTYRWKVLRASSSSSTFINSIRRSGNSEQYDPDAALRQEAFDLLDCLTCPRDYDHPEYDPEKMRRKEKLLRDIDYYELVQEMEFRGLSKLGDKVELITRLLLHVIDPSIKFEQT